MIATVFAWMTLQDAKADLGKALKAAGEWKSYAYKQTNEMEGGQGGGGGGGGGRGPQTYEGAWQKDVGLSSKSGDSEVYKVGDAVAYKAEDGTWKKLATTGGREQGGGGRRDRSAFRYRNLRAPHESLSGLEDKFKELKTETDKIGDAACTVYTGPLTEDAVKEMSQRRGRGGDDPNRPVESAAYEGSAKIWVDDKGRVAKYVIQTKASGSMGGRDFSFGMTRTVELSKFDDAAVTIPDDVKKTLEAKDEPKTP